MHATLPFLLFLTQIIAAPQLGIRRPDPLRIPLVSHTERQNHPDLEVRQEWLKAQGRGMRRKYARHLGDEGMELLRRDRVDDARRRQVKRSSGQLTLTDIGTDASYSAQVAIGTPAQDFLVIMDTGSADLWVVGSGCTSSSCKGTTSFQSESSSTYSTSETPFEISYGTGQAKGFLATDTVTMAGLTVTNQTFAIANDTTANLISSPLSGLMGLAWKSLSQSGATPFAEQLSNSGTFTDSEMGVYLQRYRGLTNTQTVESNGGEIIMGGLDTSKYTGQMNYISISTQDEAYWQIPVQAVTIDNQTVSGVTNREAAIDTGTTLVGVPAADASAIYAQIPGAQNMSASSGYQGYYQYPCDTTFSVSLQFGGLSYSISNADFNLGPFTRDTSMCTGAIFEMDLGSQAPISWIVGASFLKNVYSSFRFNPAAIGFAQLSGTAASVSNGTNSSMSSTTGGGTAGSGGTGSSSGAGRGIKAGLWSLEVSIVGVAALIVSLL